MTGSIYDDGSLEPNLDMPEHIAKWTGDAWNEISLAISKDGDIFVGGDFITAPDPNNYGREIVLEERLPSYSGPVQFIPFGKRACPYCGNTSGMKDSRGMCISCGGDLGSDSGNKREFPKPIIDWKI